MTLGLPDLHPEFLGAAAGEGRRQLTARTTLVLPGDGGVVLQAEVDPMLATLVKFAMRLLSFMRNDWEVVLRLALCWYRCWWESWGSKTKSIDDGEGREEDEDR